MALKVAFPLLWFLFVFHARCVPVDVASSQATSVQVILVTQVVTSAVEVLETSTVLVGAPSQTSNPQPSSTPLPSPPMTVPAATPSPAPETTTTDFVTITATVMPPPVTVTVSDVPSTATEITTVPPTPAPTAWTAPPQITDLSPFNVSEFAYGEDNMQIVNGIPAGASATTPTTLAVATAAIEAVEGSPPTQSIQSPTWDNSSAVLQLFYPAGSINPGSDPQGGADFYATPLNFDRAINVSMSYSVFFPQDFDWVLAGKLPGIYGGHKTCSGGDDALQCFSTRLMWREGGAGELYLVRTIPRLIQVDGMTD